MVGGQLSASLGTRLRICSSFVQSLSLAVLPLAFLLPRLNSRRLIGTATIRLWASFTLQAEAKIRMAIRRAQHPENAQKSTVEHVLLREAGTLFFGGDVPTTRKVKSAWSYLTGWL